MKIADLNVNRIGYGAMRVIDNPDIWGPPKDKANAHRVLRRAYELGANFFDTAESYGPHYSEITIAEAMHPYPKDLVIGTKCGLVRPKPSRWDEDGRPEKLRQDLEESLRADRQLGIRFPPIGVALDGQHPHLEGSGQPRHADPDPAETDNEQGFT